MIFFFGGITFYFVLDLLKVYYRKKIENEANTEDLPILTRESENVKQEFRKELSDINAQLSVLSNQASLVNEKSIQVLNSFFERCLEIKDLHSQNFGDFAGKDLGQTMLDYQIEVEKTHRKLYSDYHNLVLFHAKNQNIVANAQDIVASNHLMKTIFKKHFGNIKISILQEVGKSSDISAYSEAVKKTNQVMKDYIDEQKANSELFDKNFNSLLTSLSIYFSEYGLNYDYNELKK